MNTHARIAVVAALLLALAACTRYARLYNLETGDVLRASFKDSPAAGGMMTVTMPWGETLTGEYTVMRAGSSEWGSIYVLGVGTAAGSASSMQHLNQGSAIATGPQGTILECEFVASSVSGNATGGCRDNKGNTYRLMAG